MTESGQQGRGRQDDMPNQDNIGQPGQPAEIGGSSAEERGASGWDRFRRPPHREIQLVPIGASRNRNAALSGTSPDSADTGDGGSSSGGEPVDDIMSDGTALPAIAGGPGSGTKRRKSRKKRGHFILSLLFVAVVLLFTFGMWRYFWSPEPIAKTVVAQAVAGLLSPDDKGEAIRAVRVKETDVKPFTLLAAKPDIGPVVSPTAINLLVMARDVEANLYDTLMVVSLDPENGRIRLLNIPRDLYVDYSPESVARIRKKLPNINSDPALRKINAAHKLGKLIKYREGSSRFGSPDYDFTADLIEEMFSLSIDDFVYIYPESFKNIIDEFGGVRVDVPYSMRYSDPTQNLKIDIQAGEQLLNGYDAEGFVRFRKGYGGNGKWFEIGDLGRKENQNTFVKAFMEQNLTLGRMGKIIKLANRYMEFMETSLTGEMKIGDYAQLGTTLIAKKFVTEPVVFETRYQKIFGHEQFVLGTGVKNAKTGAEAGTGESGTGKDKPPKATPEPAAATTEGGVVVPDSSAIADASPIASAPASPETSASPDTPANPDETASPDVSASPQATASPDAPAKPDATASPDASASPQATASPDAPAKPEKTAAPDKSTPPAP